MKQSLEFKLGQQLTITPQLQQAIRLLQLSSVELQQEIQEALESNPLLEENEEFETRSASDEPASPNPMPTTNPTGTRARITTTVQSPAATWTIQPWTSMRETLHRKPFPIIYCGRCT